MGTILYTSLNEIKSFYPCTDGWEGILAGQNKTQADGIEFPILDCFNSNSIHDIIWLLSERDTEIEILVNFAKKCADSVKHINGDFAWAADDCSRDAATYSKNKGRCAYYIKNTVDYAYAAMEEHLGRTHKDYLHYPVVLKQFFKQCIINYQDTH
jgi:hypothetical protein